MLENLSRRFADIWGGLRSRKLTENNIKETLREIRRALLEADVALPVVKDFLGKVEERAVGEEVLQGVNPAQMFIDVVYQELIQLMGPVDTEIPLVKPGPTVILMAGLQGSGKTTTCGKLAHMFRKEGLRPLLVAADVQRPAAIEQLKVLGRQIGVEVFSEDGVSPPQICQHAVRHARDQNLDIVILDTAGRLHIDEAMMKEVCEVAHLTNPHQVFLVCDAMVGQDAVRSAREFDASLSLTGVILTKLDGDARGGAALSVKHITGKPIKFIGVGEKIEGGLERFRPEGMAERILGYGDVRSLVAKAREQISEEEAEELQKKLLDQTFTFDDFLVQMQRVRKMGKFKDLIGMMPGIGAYAGEMDIDDKDFLRIEAIIQSMTPKERQRPEILNTGRRDRIARGSGTQRTEVDDLIRQFNSMKKVMDQLGQVGGGKGPLGKIKSMMNAKKQMADLPGMLGKFAEADPQMGLEKKKGTKKAAVSRDVARKKRKDQRKARRKGRRK